MIDAGLPIVQCLDILAQQTENKKFRGMIRQMKEDVEAGSTFSEALRKHPKLFDELFLSMVEAGEIGGILDTILNRLSGYMEKSLALKRKIKGAMIYPVTVVHDRRRCNSRAAHLRDPGIRRVVRRASAQALPAPTQFVINLSDFTIAYYPFHRRRYRRRGRTLSTVVQDRKRATSDRQARSCSFRSSAI